MSVFRNHYSDLSYHNVIGFTINRIFRLPNPVEFSSNGKWKRGGGYQMQGFRFQEVLYLSTIFLKGGGIKFRFIKLPNSIRIVVVFTKFFLLI